MIEEYIFRPGVFVVAIGAHRALCAAVRIIVFVTVATACQRLRFEQGLDVAGRTFHCDVCPMECMIGVDVMVEGDLDEPFRNVTRIAALSEMRLMVVVISMAGDTCGIHGIAERFVRMAIVADQQTVFAH